MIFGGFTVHDKIIKLSFIIYIYIYLTFSGESVELDGFELPDVEYSTDSSNLGHPGNINFLFNLKLFNARITATINVNNLSVESTQIFFYLFFYKKNLDPILRPTCKFLILASSMLSLHSNFNILGSINFSEESSTRRQYKKKDKYKKNYKNYR